MIHFLENYDMCDINNNMEIIGTIHDTGLDYEGWEENKRGEG